MSYFCSSDPYSSFLEVLSRDLGSTPKSIESEKIVRFDDLDGKPGNKACWAILFLGEPAAGAYGNWRTGFQATWHAKGSRRMIESERQQLIERVSVARRQKQAETFKTQEKAADRAKRIWRESLAATPSHPYLVKKKITPCFARQKDSLLVLPIINSNRTLTSLQFISPSGEKKLLSGGKKRGSYIPINSPAEFSRLLICEGFATGSTLAEGDPQAKVIAAIDAGNLELVAVFSRATYPDLEIVICADADPIGLEKARKAAIKAGANMAVPEFSPGVNGTDFNDLVSLAGGV
jgi:putative DNA primase/helicase